MKLRPVIAAGLSLAFLAASPTAAHAETLPFNDPNVSGFLGFCDANDNPITSGSLDSQPFVPKVVASAASPDAYGPSKGGKATLYAYQPREGYDPGEWSNGMLTGSSRYTSQSHPMAEGTVLDPSMKDQVAAYPAVWDNLVQLRLIFSAPNMQPRLAPYSASVIRVVGDRWEMVNPQTLPCNEGKAVSFEREVLPAAKFTAPAPRPGSSSVPQNKTASAASSASASAGTRSPGSDRTSSTQSGAPGVTNTAAVTKAGARGPAIALVLAVLATAAGAAAGLAWWRTRRVI